MGKGNDWHRQLPYACQVHLFVKALYPTLAMMHPSPVPKLEYWLINILEAQMPLGVQLST